MRAKKSSLGRIKQVAIGIHANMWMVYFVSHGRKIHSYYSTEQEAIEHLEDLRQAHERGDKDYILQIARDALKEAEKAKLQRASKARRKATAKDKILACRKELNEFTHTLILPMRTPREKCDYLIRALKQADQSQIICNERPITIPPHRIIYLGLRIPREGGAYVYQTALRILGWNSAFKIKKISTTKPKKKED